MTCFRLVHVRFFLGFPDFVSVVFVPFFKLAAVGTAVEAGRTGALEEEEEETCGG